MRRLLLLLVSLSLPSTVLSSDLPQDPCLDFREVADPSSVTLPSKFVSADRPWMRKDVHPRLFTSKGMQYNWMWLRSLPVKGLHPNTIEDVLFFLDSSNCSFIAWGDVVWKTVRGLKPLTLQGEVSCDLLKLEEACFARFGWNGCSLMNKNTTLPTLMIGQVDVTSRMGVVEASPLLLFPAHSKWDVPWPHLGYTVDSLAIHDNMAGHIYLVDMTGQGFEDICNRRVRPAVDEKEWGEWSEGQQTKLLKYFELRAQDFGAGDDSLRRLIERELKNGSASLSPNDVRLWYCEGDLLKGVLQEREGETRICNILEPDGSSQRRLKAAREALEDDTPVLWKSVIQPSLADTEEAYLTPRQFHSLFTSPSPRPKTYVVKTSTRNGDVAVPLQSDGPDSFSHDSLTIPAGGERIKFEDYDVGRSISMFSFSVFVLLFSFLLL